MIGVFDSGVGGLYTLRALRRLCPHADFVYYADEAHLPYGARSAPELLRLSCRALRFLIAHGAHALVIACGTVSSTVYTRLAADCPVPLFEAASPLAAAAVDVLRDKRDPQILLLATAASVKAGRIAAMVKVALPHARITAYPCPAFVPLSERLTDENWSATAAATEKVLAPLGGRKYDAVLLGCTHFSALAPFISDWAKGVRILDGAALCAAHASRGIPAKKWGDGGRVTLYTSGDPLVFGRAAARILGEECPVFGANTE